VLVGARRLGGSLPRVRLAPLVTSVTYRHPALLANIAAAVDQISGGRLVLGIGAGWQENEHTAYGMELGTIRERLDRFEEAVRVVASLLSQPRTTFSGKYFQLEDAPNQPMPVQAHVPLLIGGAGERRTMRIAAQYADEWNTWSTPDLLAHKVSVLRAHCDEVGRDHTDIAVSTQAMVYLSKDTDWLDKKRQAASGRPEIIGTPTEVVDMVGRYRDAGANELIIPDFTFGPLARVKDTYDLFMQEVVPAFR
jgi:alkanesulfonate monooxygenase SsuD/methylene tetrahydromethanopterin reductase-like flavin-dependent oxidoreductase (luciferase family)